MDIQPDCPCIIFCPPAPFVWLTKVRLAILSIVLVTRIYCRAQESILSILVSGQWLDTILQIYIWDRSHWNVQNAWGEFSCSGNWQIHLNWLLQGYITMYNIYAIKYIVLRVGLLGPSFHINHWPSWKFWMSHLLSWPEFDSSPIPLTSH